MTHATRRALLFAAAALPAAPRIARAQAWPQRPIRWIVNFPPAGASRAPSPSILGTASASRSSSKIAPAPAACSVPTSSPRRAGMRIRS